MFIFSADGTRIASSQPALEGASIGGGVEENDGRVSAENVDTPAAGAEDGDDDKDEL